MLEILQFMFSDGWHFFGCLLFVGIILIGLEGIFSRKRVTVVKYKKEKKNGQGKTDTEADTPE